MTTRKAMKNMSQVTERSVYACKLVVRPAVKKKKRNHAPQKLACTAK